jgi:hypothetical protein
LEIYPGEVEGSYGGLEGVFLFLEKTSGVFLFPSFLTAGGHSRGLFFSAWKEGEIGGTNLPTNHHL